MLSCEMGYRQGTATFIWKLSETNLESIPRYFKRLVRSKIN